MLRTFKHIFLLTNKISVRLLIL